MTSWNQQSSETAEFQDQENEWPELPSFLQTQIF